MHLTAALAQQIIDKITPFMPHHVNIMDGSGLIIASSQPSRINTLHAGAKLALTSGEPVEIGAHDAGQYPRSLPGLNWPLP